MSANRSEPASSVITLPSGSSMSILYHLPPRPSPTSPTVLFLPFWGGSARTFASVRDALVLKFPSTISVAVSYPGTGTATSDTSDVNSEKHSIPALASDLLAALQAQKFRDLIPSGRIIIVAHSMSAKIAYELLAAISSPLCPVTIRLTSLLLLAPAPPTPLVLPNDMRQQQLTAYSTFGSARWIMANILTHTPMPDHMLDSLARDASNQSEGAKRGWIEVGMGHDCTAALHALSETGNNVPIRVLVGSADQVETVGKVRRETLEPFAAAGWNVSLRVLEVVGHLLPVEAVDEVVGEIKVLLELERS